MHVNAVLHRFVTKELISRGFNVTAFAREKAGIKGKMSKEDSIKVRGGTRRLCGAEQLQEQQQSSS